MPTVAELAQQELQRRYSLQGRTQVAPRVQTMQNARPTVRSALSNLMRDAVDATGLEGGYRQGLLNAAEGVETAADFLPVVGDVLGLEDASRAYGQGDMVGAGINMLGAVPIVGDVAAKGARSALRGLRMTEDEYIQAINPTGQRISAEARPNLGMGDMYGMAPRNASEVMKQELPSGEVVRYVEGDDGVYALGYNPDLGEEDVVGYMLGGGDSSELAVVDQMQGQGIGGNLSYLYRSKNPMAQSGGLTEAGEASARSAFRRMSEEARMQRAKDLGFEEDIYYKGMYPYDFTKESGDYAGPEITEINRPEEFPAFNDGEKGVDIAGFLTKDPEVANRFAGSDGRGAVYPLRYRRGKVYTIDANGRNAGELQFGESGKEFRDAVRSGNYDTIEIINTADEGDITISTKPENIRSTNAEFDPAKADSADLLSSVGATSALRGVA